MKALRALLGILLGCPSDPALSTSNVGAVHLLVSRLVPFCGPLMF